MAKRQLGIIKTSYGSGYGSGSGYGYGSGYGSGSGYGYGYGSGSGDGYGSGSGDGYGYGDGSGDGSGYGYGDGYGSGDGYGYGSGYGDGYGYGYGYGSGSGDGYGDNTIIRKKYFTSLSSVNIINYPNAELRREMIEAKGNEFFAELNGAIIHQDIDGCNNQRQLIAFKVPGARNGYLHAIKVICPTTGRVYYLNVPQSCKTCQEAIASTFGKKPENYNPARES